MGDLIGVGGAAEDQDDTENSTPPFVCGWDASEEVDKDSVPAFGPGGSTELPSTPTSFISTSFFSSVADGGGEDVGGEGSVRWASGEDGAGGGGIAALTSLAIAAESFPSAGEETREACLEAMFAFSSVLRGCLFRSACLFFRVCNKRFDPRCLLSSVNAEGGSSFSFSVCVEALE